MKDALYKGIERCIRLMSFKYQQLFARFRSCYPNFIRRAVRWPAAHFAGTNYADLKGIGYTSVAQTHWHPGSTPGVRTNSCLHNSHCLLFREKTMNIQILKLDVGGRPVAWITREEGALLYCRDQVAWEAGTEKHLS